MDTARLMAQFMSGRGHGQEWMATKVRRCEREQEALAVFCSTGSIFTSIPTKYVVSIINTKIAAVALDLGHAVGPQSI